MDIKVADLGGLKSKLTEKLKKNKYLLLILAVGLLLILLPVSKKSDGGRQSGEGGMSVPEFSISAEEAKLGKALAQIDGAGRVSVALTLRSSVSQELAEDERGSYRKDEQGSDVDSDNTVVTVSTGSGTQSAVAVKYYYPEYQGALVICDGGGSSEIRLKITEAVSALTGLGTDKITVVKMKKSGG